MKKAINYILAYLSYRRDLKNIIKKKGNDTLFPFAKKRLILNEKFTES